MVLSSLPETAVVPTLLLMIKDRDEMNENINTLIRMTQEKWLGHDGTLGNVKISFSYFIYFRE